MADSVSDSSRILAAAKRAVADSRELMDQAQQSLERCDEMLIRGAERRLDLRLLEQPQPPADDR